ncbi:MAG: MFS transporter, partial [Arenimonas sp.]|nr:MFS transporter [Arenimonas sp.]
MTQAPPTAGRFDHLRGALREFPPLLWSFLYFFFLLTGYYVLRPVREAIGASGDVQEVFPPGLVDLA